MRIRLWVFLAAAPLPIQSGGTPATERPILPQEREKRSFSAPSSPPFYTSSSFSFFNQLPLTQSLSTSHREFISSLWRPEPRWIRPLKSFHRHLGGSGRRSFQGDRKHTRGGPGSEWSGHGRWNVCTQTRNEAKGEARCQTKRWTPSNLWPGVWNWRPIRNMCVRSPFLSRRRIW